MRKLWGVVLLIGCGGANFTGTWRGDVTTLATCGTMTSSDVGPVAMALTQQGDDLDVTLPGGCRSLTGDVTGNVAAIRGRDCMNGFLITGGRFELVQPDKLAIEILMTNTSSCSARLTGTLDLQM